MRLFISLLLILTANSAWSVNTVRLQQLRSVEGCEDDGKGIIQVVMNIGEVKPSDRLQSYEVGVSYKGQPLKIMLPALFANTMSNQIPAQYRFFGSDGEREELFGSAASISSGTNGISGSGFLFGFSVAENSTCDTVGELKITQFFVNEECSIDFEIDSTLVIEKDYSEDFISELGWSADISSLTTNIGKLKDTVTYSWSNTTDKEIQSASLMISTDTSKVSYKLVDFADSDSLQKSDNMYTFYRLESEKDSMFAKIEYEYVGDKGEKDTVQVEAKLEVVSACSCVVLSQTAMESVGTRIIYQAPVSVSISDTGNRIWYSNGLHINGYNGTVTIVDINGRKIANERFEAGKIVLETGIYMILLEDNKIEKIIVNTF